MKIPTLLITGGNGQLAWDLQRFVTDNTINLIACSRETLDITDPVLIQQAFKQFQPDMIINTAAYTAVDKAEQETELAFRINRDGAANLARACSDAQIPLIHLSTDYVFDGQKTTPYQENDQVNPLGIYGQSKWEGEEAVRQYCPQHIILRVSGVFGRHGHNFVKTILRVAGEREILRIVADQITCPTPAADIAATIIILAKQLYSKQKEKPLFGTYHYCSNAPTTWHHFAETIIEMASSLYPLQVKEIQPISTAEYPTAAKRPPYCVLDTQKIHTQFGIQPCSWRQELLEVIKHVNIQTP
jgi:dTDP-4-dehydrorhamnose reductase